MGFKSGVRTKGAGCFPVGDSLAPATTVGILDVFDLIIILGQS